MTTLTVQQSLVPPEPEQIALTADAALLRAHNRAKQRFSDEPWPTKAMEEYRRTDIAPLKLDELVSTGEVFVPQILPAPAQSISSCTDTRQYSIMSIATAAAESSDRYRMMYQQAVDRADNRIELWNLVAGNGGYIIDVPAGEKVEAPIEIVVECTEATPLTAPQIFIHVGVGSIASLVIRYRGSRHAPGVVNAFVDCDVEQGAQLYLTEIQVLESVPFFSHGYARLAADARLFRHESHFGSSFVKTRFAVSLEGPHGEANLQGLIMASGSQHVDVRTVQVHAARSSQSKASYKTVTTGQASVIHQGLIRVLPGGQGTDAYLSTKNLLLSDSARVDSIPGLQIDTNDLRCSHGSTTGHVSDEELFYLMCRGLPPEAARQLVVAGFLCETLGGAVASVQPELEALIDERCTATFTEAANGSVG